MEIILEVLEDGTKIRVLTEDLLKPHPDPSFMGKTGLECIKQDKEDRMGWAKYHKILIEKGILEVSDIEGSS